ncbi:alpha/beta fold hydrolase [Cellulophaga baltica]|uniref:alpha/beta fold hydrolase n=1 Tax=Cellulophaga TaxID=104264 RepID=UPI001C0742BC|nr:MULTISPECIES: alpha/beta hydrolase [Cellulophaga]MBU2995302.1 alpha/beta fold hydrolase [Cellulophaga baltica]MDO6766697.1 alpha/beta fold hydrolase [Cellulophaga sp. 1_MG-2023]
MKMYYVKFIIILCLIFTVNIQAQDTLVDVGGYKIHFNILKGEGTPILFEAGAGNDATVWNSILEQIHQVTGTTLISYDRSGFGQSELNPNLKNATDYGILNGLKELEVGLLKLGYDNDILLVSHSYGGLYNLLYADKYPEKVKSVVLIDVTLNNFWNDELLAMRDANVDINQIEKNTGDYYLNYNYNRTMRYGRQVNFPNTIPIINVFPENSFPGFPAVLSKRWLQLHKDFGAQNKNVENSIAKGSTHAIFQDNPALIVHIISKAYSETLPTNQQNTMLKKALSNAIEMTIETKINNRSEHDLNTLGYTFLQNEEIAKALAIFKTNTLLFPGSSNVYDSYGEALVKANRNEEAIEMYEKALELNPKNENTKVALQKIKKEK